MYGMNSFASRFKAGSDIAKDLINTYEMGQRKKEFGDIASAQDAPDFTAEERAAMEAKANAVNADGQPIYTFGKDAQGNVTTTLNKEAVPGAVDESYTPAALARSGVNYLGKTYDAPLSDGQRLGAQQQAMAGVLDKSGDIEGAMRYRQQAQQGELSDLQLAQAKRTGAREDKADAYETSRQEAFNNSVFGQQNAAYATKFQDYVAAKGKYESAIAAGQPPQTIGLPPQPPTRATYSLADSLADQGALLANDAKHGKVDAKTFGAFSESMRKIEDEGYLKALNLAQGGASLDEVAKAFNSSGQIKFDPKNVISDTTAPGQGGVPERVLTIKDENGNTQSINVMAQLQSLGKAGDALNQFYAGETNRRGNAAEVRADKSLSLQQQTTNATVGARTDAKNAKDAAAAAGVALYKQEHPNATPADLEAVKQGVLSAVPKVDSNAPAEVKLANAYMKAGITKTEAEALKMATQSKADSPAKVRADLYGKALASNLGDANKAKQVTEEAMTYLFPAATAAGTATPGATKDTEKVIQAGTNKGKTAVFDGTGWALKP